MRKKILVVSAYFHPDITPRSFRTTELVKHLVKLGHEVTLCIPYRSFDYSTFLGDYPMKIEYITKRELGVHLPKGESFIKRAYRAMAYQYMHWLEYPNIKLYYAIPKILQDKSGYDLLISIAAPHTIHWGCDKAIRSNSLLSQKWIADCGDPYMGDSVVKKPFYFKWFEKSFCQRANFISVPIETAIRAYYPEFQHKLRVIPQGFNFDDVKIFLINNKNKKPTFAYAGILYPNYRDLNSFVDFISSLNKDFCFILYTPPSELTKKYKKKLGNKIVINDVVPRDILLEKLSKMDFLINISNKSAIQLPSKLIDYALLKKPIMTISEILDKKLVLEFLSQNYERQTIVDNIDSYDIKNVVNQFLKL